MNSADNADAGAGGAINRRQLLTYSTATVSLAALLALARSELAAAADTWTHPFASYATHNADNPFGRFDQKTYPTSPHKHRGSDFNKTGDILVRAVRPGRVVHVGEETFAGGMLGNTVVIEHSDHWSLYAHFQWGSQRVAHGQQVTAGMPLGLMGNTGRSYGAHLHLEIGSGTWNSARPWTVLQNPYELVGRAPLPGQTQPPEPTQESGEPMEVIVKAPNGVVVHLMPGHKHNFATVGEYNTFRDQVNFLRNAGVSNLMALPELSKVPGVTWDTFNYICLYLGIDPT